MQSPPSPEEINELVDRHTRPSPESAKQDPSWRRTEIYMRNEEMTEHIKLQENTDFELNLIDKLRREDNQQTHDKKTKDKVDELIATNAATQATISAMAAESTSMKSMLSQLMSYLPFATANQTDHMNRKLNRKLNQKLNRTTNCKLTKLTTKRNNRQPTLLMTWYTWE